MSLQQAGFDSEPNYPDGYYNLANALSEKGDIEDAICYYQKAITLNPNYIEAYKKLGNAFLKQGLIEQAIDSYQQALNLDPNYCETNYIEVYKNMGLIFELQGQLENAIACYQQVLNLHPNYIEVYNNLGVVFGKQGQYENAIACCHQALNLDPNHIEAYNNLGVVFEKQGQYENAIACYQQALNLNPNYTEAYNNLGVVFTEQGQYEAAIECCNQALELNPDYALAHFHRGLLLLLTGNFELGFAEYEWRLQCPQYLEYYRRDLSEPLWDGSNLDGRTILLHSEQGFGDTIQFIRYAHVVAQLGGRVVVECHESLLRLLTTVTGIEQLVVRGEALPEFHVHARLMSLPRILGTTLENVPAQVPYLAAPESPIKLLAPTGSRLKVGIVWAGSSTHQRDRIRSCSLNHFFGLLNTQGIAFYSLQTGPRVAELAQLSCDLPVQDLSTHLGDFADTAALVAQLDLVITVDTAVAHLAGALNKPVWVLLPFSPDWRWMIGREDSPWYPTMRLFRQESLGDWAGLLKQVEKALKTLTS